MSQPAYIELGSAGELTRRAERVRTLRDAEGCHLCPRECGVDRNAAEPGECGVAGGAAVASAAPHFGEEPCLVGRGGSGTIFFAGCNLHCVFCQNHDLSQAANAYREVGAHELAAIMLGLQARGVENVNFVTPSHVVPELLEALVPATEAGLDLPLVYNTSGYDRVDVLRLLEGVVDIYMPDLKYSDPAAAERCSLAPDYPDVARAAIKEMHRQVGDLVVDDRGVAERGLLVRHLVLPGGLAGTSETVKFLAEEVSENTAVNIMDQYRPAYLAHGKPPLSQRPERQEFLEARRLAEEAGLRMVEEI